MPPNRRVSPGAAERARNAIPVQIGRDRAWRFSHREFPKDAADDDRLELSADSFGNPQNARVKRLIGARSVVVGRTMPFVFLFGRHSDAPSSGPSNEKQRGSAERKSESRAVVAERKETCCWRSLHVGRQYPNTFQRTVVRREGAVLPRIGSVLHFLRKSDPNSAGIGGVHSALPDRGGSCSAIGAH